MYVTVDANSMVVDTKISPSVRELAFKVRANILTLEEAERTLEKRYGGDERRLRYALVGLRLLADW